MFTGDGPNWSCISSRGHELPDTTAVLLELPVILMVPWCGLRLAYSSAHTAIRSTCVVQDPGDSSYGLQVRT